MGWVAFVSPLLITWTLVFVSGVPMLEKKMAEKPGWAEYAARTSVFVPLPPKKG
jgi:steroid 5-alpha reductase family enzyme